MTMSMIAMQTVIAKLCLDHEFCQSFAGSPDRALESCGLTAMELEEIKSVDLQAIREYAASLLGKRLGLIKKWLPLSFLLLAKQLSAAKVHTILKRYSSENIRGTDGIGGDWVRMEFDRVAKYLRQLVATREIESPYFTDVLAFEVLRFSMLNDLEIGRRAIEAASGERTRATFISECQRGARPALGKHACVQVFNYNLAELIPLVEQEQAIPALELKPTWVLCFKKPRALGISTSVINPALKQLIELCDGGRTIDGISSAIAAQLGVTEAGARDECLAALEQLYIGGAVSFKVENEPGLGGTN
jgi:hypothetical protein